MGALQRGGATGHAGRLLPGVRLSIDWLQRCPHMRTRGGMGAFAASRSGQPHWTAGAGLTLGVQCPVACTRLRWQWHTVPVGPQPLCSRTGCAGTTVSAKHVPAATFSPSPSRLPPHLPTTSKPKRVVTHPMIALVAAAPCAHCTPAGPPRLARRTEARPLPTSCGSTSHASMQNTPIPPRLMPWCCWAQMAAPR